MNEWPDQALEAKQCRVCRWQPLLPVLDLGNQHLSDFRQDLKKPPRHPLRLVHCMNCGLAQLSHTAPPEELYHDNYSFRSGISDAIKVNLMQVVTHAAMAHASMEHPDDRPRWLDIASNDGTLLSMVPPDRYQRFGVDPLRHLCEVASEHADQIVVGMFDPAMFEDSPPFDIITSISMFYDLDDPLQFVQGVKSILARDGVWVVQQNYLPDMLRNISFDNISHEHLTYWDLETFDALMFQCGMRVIDVVFDPINGGCFRTVVVHQDSLFEVLNPQAVTQALNAEADYYLNEETADVRDRARRLHQFAQEARWAATDVHKFVESMRPNVRSIWLYGASTRGAVIWQAAGLDVKHFPYVVERNPDKVGRIMSAIGVPIVSEEFMRVQGPDYLLVGPWWLRDQILEREHDYLVKGGQIVFPLPKLEVVSHAPQ